MRKRTWLPAKPKAPPIPAVSEDVREAIDVQAKPLIASLKKRFCKKPKSLRINWCDDIFARWHHNALYIVVVMRTPHGFPESFETHAARMQHSGKGKFNLAVPMRRGWNTFLEKASPEECLKEIAENVSI